MTTVIDAVAPDGTPASRGGSLVGFLATGGRVLVLLCKLIGAALSCSLAVFNGWWYWRETRPLEDLATAVAC